MSTERGQISSCRQNWGNTTLYGSGLWFIRSRREELTKLNALMLSLPPSEPKGGDHVIEHAPGTGSVIHPSPTALLTSLQHARLTAQFESTT